MPMICSSPFNTEASHNVSVFVEKQRRKEILTDGRTVGQRQNNIPLPDNKQTKTLKTKHLTKGTYVNICL